MEQLSGVWAHCVQSWAPYFMPAAPHFGLMWWPIAAYWALAGFYDLLDHVSHPAVARYRVTRVEPGRSNGISRTHVVGRVVLVHGIQVLMALIMAPLDPDLCSKQPGSWASSISQFIMGMVVMDAWQFWIHRTMHVNTFLYKHVHSVHHKLLIPYAYGALYNHPLESLLLDTLGALVSMYCARMDCQVAAPFFTISTVKTVFDHSGYRFPINPIHNLFPNSAAFHDVHHDLRYIKKNFSQPWFTWWDMLLGSWVDPNENHLHLAPSEITGSSVAGGLAVDLKASSRSVSQEDLKPQEKTAPRSKQLEDEDSPEQQQQPSAARRRRRDA